MLQPTLPQSEACGKNNSGKRTKGRSDPLETAPFGGLGGF